MTVDPYEEERQRSLEEYERRERKPKVIRVSDTERERAIRQLRQHLAEGRIDMEEFTERMDLVYRAKTNVDVEQALHELPFVSVDPAVVTKPLERRQVGPFVAIGDRGGQGLARHTAVFALTASAVFGITAIVTMITGSGAFGLLLLPMGIWAVALFLQAIRELNRGDHR